MIDIKMARTLVATVMLVLAAVPATAAPHVRADAWMDRAQIGLGESVSLHVRAPGGAGAPDWSALQRDFEIADVAQGFRTTIVNGRADSSMEWTLTLFPKHAGTIQVPALRVGDAETVPLSVEVRTAASADRGPADGGTADGSVGDRRDPIYMEAEVTDPSPYMQGKTLLTVRLLSARSVLEGAIGEPEVADAFVERVGEDKTYHKQIGGRAYTVFERQYAVFPQTAGTVVIPPVQFDGRVESDRRGLRRDPFGSALGSSFFDDFFDNPLRRDLLGGFFDSGETVRLRTKAIALDVRAKPAQAAGSWWLPAKRVDVIEEWQDAQPTFRVGEQTTRIVTLQAVGLAASQLPDLELPAIDGAKQYVEPAAADTALSGNDTVAIKRQTAVLIPTRPGKLVLPEIRVDWWDVGAEQARTAVLPEHTVEVLPGTGAFDQGAAQAAPVPSAAPRPQAESPASAKVATEGAELPIAGSHQGASRPWWWSPLPAALALAALALAAAGALLLRRVRGRRAPLPPAAGGGGVVGAVPSGSAGAVGGPAFAASSSAAAAVDLGRAERMLADACERSDAAAAVQAVLALGRARWPERPTLSLTAFAERMGSSELRAALDGLARARYAAGDDAAGGHESSWNGAELWRSYRAATRGGGWLGRAVGGSGPGNGRDYDPLPALYPTG